MVTESQVKEINDRLMRFYGRQFDLPLWRVVNSENEFENRLTGYDDHGNELQVPEIRELPKYRQWLHNQWILERLMPVPEINMKELVTPLSYECLYAFDSGIFPSWEALAFVISVVNSAAAKAVGVANVDPDIEVGPITNDMEYLEYRRKKMLKVHADLFGNESDISTQLAYGEGVSLAGPKLTDEGQS